VTFGNAQHVAVGFGGTILTCPDSINWTPQVSGTVERLLSVVFGNALFVTVGTTGLIQTSPPPTFIPAIQPEIGIALVVLVSFMIGIYSRKRYPSPSNGNN